MAILAVMLVLCLIAAVAGIRWKKDENLRFAKQLGMGINLGNSLDATGLWDYKPDAEELEYEISWNNPVITREQFMAIREAGFQTVRIPVSWADHMDEEGHVSEVWMNRVQEVVDMALGEDLYVILDTHHEKWMSLIPDQEEVIEERLRTLWKQIAIRFESYDERLLFEGMNEPRQHNSEYEWNEGTEELREMVNNLNYAFVETVRESGGKNESRYLLITTYAGNSLEQTMEALEIPRGHIMVAIHAYLPYDFCQNKEGTTQWSEDNLQDTEELQRTFMQMNQLFIQEGIPVVVTEFGCVDKNNLESRQAWTQYYVKLAKDNDIVCVWWDDGIPFQLLDRDNSSWKYPELVESLTGESLE